ncbi:hypothetical protein XIS1_1670012 [Xenorhabdus innexi]|uniref:Uncharacterized protein n=1 Tax=Xenorhabdus innexi TaxID=290109 RepID=A0A1N6MVB6_9GAMM|nr:hypothetical protein XIS1_1670012 [Xenorhabdus innexi]
MASTQNNPTQHVTIRQFLILEGGINFHYDSFTHKKSATIIALFHWVYA